MDGRVGGGHRKDTAVSPCLRPAQSARRSWTGSSTCPSAWAAGAGSSADRRRRSNDGSLRRFPSREEQCVTCVQAHRRSDVEFRVVDADDDPCEHPGTGVHLAQHPIPTAAQGGDVEGCQDPLSAVAKWQDGTVHSVSTACMGLGLGLPELAPSNACLGELAAPQQLAPPHSGIVPRSRLKVSRNKRLMLHNWLF